MRRCTSLALALALAGCGGLAAQARAVANATADVANAGGRVLLAGYCAAQMDAIGREGRYVAGRCEAHGPRARAEATPDELDALERVRARWRPLLARHTELARVHDALADVLAAGSRADVADVLARTGSVAAAYRDLVEGATTAGLRLPALGGE